jgi:uncharacterized protein YrrD
MLRSTNDIHGYTVHATDGDIGKVKDFLLDEQTWTVRYLVVKTGNWLSERQVLITPMSFKGVRWDDKRFDVNLTRQQVKESPDISTDMPVSRQQEQDLLAFYNYPLYWEGTEIWGTSVYPMLHSYINHDLVKSSDEAHTTPTDRQIPQEEEPVVESPNLRSAREVSGYRVRARDEDIGHVETLLIDDETWSIRYMVVDAKKWLSDRYALILPDTVNQISWTSREVSTDLPRETISEAPAGDILSTEGVEHSSQHTGSAAGVTVGVIGGILVSVPASAPVILLAATTGGVVGGAVGYAGELAADKVEESSR